MQDALLNFPSQAVNFSIIPVDELKSLMQTLIRQEIRAKQNEELQEKLISPAETCKLFQPQISKVTLNKWTKDGRLQEHRIGGRVFYKYSEVINSLQTLKRYSKSV